jgi:hypothetical protein
MKLIVVRRTAAETYKRLSSKFSDDPNVKVVWERRTRERRKKPNSAGPERRSSGRRKFTKPWNNQGYFVVHTAEEEPRTKPPSPRPVKDPWFDAR